MINEITAYIDSNTSNAGQSAVYKNLAKYGFQCMGTSDVSFIELISDYKSLFISVWNSMGDESQDAVSKSIKIQVRFANS